jgi:hypothetical protein
VPSAEVAGSGGGSSASILPAHQPQAAQVRQALSSFAIRREFGLASLPIGKQIDGCDDVRSCHKADQLTRRRTVRYRAKAELALRILSRGRPTNGRHLAAKPRLGNVTVTRIALRFVAD